MLFYHLIGGTVCYYIFMPDDSMHLATDSLKSHDSQSLVFWIEFMTWNIYKFLFLQELKIKEISLAPAGWWRN